MEGTKILENLFYSITIVSTFTCVIRSDYNFAFGLLCYYMIKTSKDQVKTAKPVRNLYIQTHYITYYLNVWFIYFSYHILWYYLVCVVVVDKPWPGSVRHPLVHYDELGLVGQTPPPREDLARLRQHQNIHTRTLSTQHIHQGIS